jgi:RNA polymerase sigma-70 factor (sigma-E family)
VKQADEEEFRQYVTSQLERLRRAAYVLCHDWHTADDLVATTLGKLYRNWSRARDVVHRDAYVRKMLVRTWLDELRRPWRREFVTDEVPDQAVPDETELLDGRWSLELLADLTPRRRAAVALRFYFGLSVDDTAEVLRCSPGTVRSLTTRGLESVREQAAARNTPRNGEAS